MSLDISNYKPGRFDYLMSEPFAAELWKFLSDKKQVDKMFLAVAKELPAIEFILNDLEEKFGSYLQPEAYPEEDVGIFANNMIKQIMQCHGYTYTACALCPDGKYIKMSGFYTKPE